MTKSLEFLCELLLLTSSIIYIPNLQFAQFLFSLDDFHWEFENEEMLCIMRYSGKEDWVDSWGDKKGIIHMSIKAFLSFLSDGLTWNRNENENNDTKIC